MEPGFFTLGRLLVNYLIKILEHGNTECSGSVVQTGSHMHSYDWSVFCASSVCVSVFTWLYVDA